MAMYGCDFFAVLECKDMARAQMLYKELKPKVNSYMSCPNHDDIYITNVILEARIIHVLFTGDAIAGYCVFFKLAEEHLHAVAFIRIGSFSELPTYDPMDVEMLNDEGSMRARSSYYCQREEHLIVTFITKVCMATYTEEFVQRVVQMCCLGKDRNNAEHYALLHLQDYTSGVLDMDERIKYWRDGISHCHTTGDDMSEWREGDNLLVRVLGHLVYAEDLNNTSIVTRFKNRGKGLRRLSLSQ